MNAPGKTQIHHHRDFVGSFVGICVFLGGIGILIFVFRLALEMFSIPERTALGIDHGKKLDLASAGESLTSIMIRIMLLMLMALVGSWIANRGITLYTHSRGIKVKVDEP